MKILNVKDDAAKWLVIAGLVCFIIFSAVNEREPKVVTVEKPTTVTVTEVLQPWQAMPESSANFTSTPYAKMDCDYSGCKICCELIDPAFNYSNNKTYPTSRQKISSNTGTRCSTSKIYFPSDYEIFQLAKAEEIGRIQDFDQRKQALLQFLDDDIINSTIWLRQVKTLSTDKSTRINYLRADTADKNTYLSRFQIHENCESGVRSTKIEYIEPITVHARHPFAYASFYPFYDKKRDIIGDLWTSSVFNIDYILISYLPHYRDSTNYFLDAGTSFFRSSLMWFICAYLSRNVAFDKIFGWEYSLAEPIAFWNDVPQKIIPLYSFYNYPVNNDPTSHSNIGDIILNHVEEEDFLSFKLDIDTPEIEVPLFQRFLTNSNLASRLDEFFFELHFRCELMMYLGWGDRMPEVLHGLELNRYSAMKAFQQLRKQGVRSHFWI